MAFADSNSVVSMTEMTNIRAKSLSMKIETESDPGGRQPGNVIPPQVNCSAHGGSVILADRLSDVTIDGHIDVSVCVKSSQGRAAGTVGETLTPPKGPTGKFITDHKVELIDCLMADLFVLQHVHAEGIVTDGQYQNLKSLSHPEKTVTDLIDQIIGKGEDTCVQFCQLLKKPEVLETYPKLRHILNL
ncbi:uncharacterized protein KZ484_010635 [Pholidichthys leucotaenia]